MRSVALAFGIAVAAACAYGQTSVPAPQRAQPQGIILMPSGGAMAPSGPVPVIQNSPWFQSGQVSTALGTMIPAARQQPARFDCAADGVVVNAITGEAIARARVTAMGAGASPAASTDSSGRWSLTNIACGFAQFTGTRPGYLQDGFGPPGGRIFMPRRVAPLTPDAPAHDVRIALTPQSVIAGKVVDDQGDPVMNVQVHALAARVVEGRLSFQPAATGNTNDLGEYRIPSLHAGKYIVCAHLNSFQNGPPQQTQMVWADACYPGPLEEGAGSAMDLTAGRETNVNLALNQVSAVHVTGQITGIPQGRGMGISMMRRGTSPGYGTNFPASVRPDGTFDISGVTPGSFLIMADYVDAGKRMSARVPVEVGSSNVENVAVQLESGITVAGTVRVESPPPGVSVPGRQIPFNLRSSEPMNSGNQVKWSEDFSSFTISEVLPGRYHLEVFPSGLYVKSATMGGQDLLHGDISFTQGAGPIDIVLSGDAGSIEGDVADSGGLPVNVGLMLIPKGGGRPVSQFSQPNGHFKMANVPPGDYTLYAWDNVQEVQYADPAWMTRYATGGLAVTVGAGQNLQQIKVTQEILPQ